MKKDAVISKKAKAIIASAMAMTLAIPSVAMMGGTTPVQADDENALPEPIAVYTFEDAESEQVKVVDNGAAPTVGTDDKKKGTVLTLTNSKQIEVTSAGTDASGNAVVNTTTEYMFSEATVPNPFKGMTDLEEEPTFVNKKNPIWENGVTISYWVKAAEEDSSLITFTNSRDNVMIKNDMDKYNLHQRYIKNPDDPIFSMGVEKEIEYKSGKTYTNDAGETALIKSTLPAGTYTVLVGAGPFVRFNHNYQGDACYLVEKRNSKGKLSEFTLVSIGDPYTKEEYSDPTLPTSKLEYGSVRGGLQLNSSGSWVYTDTEQLTETFINGVSQGKGDKHSSARNHAYANTFLPVTDADGNTVNTYQEDALVNTPAEWHYVTRVIKNDSISTYIDGELKDYELYTDGLSEHKVYANKGFNVGWGYYQTASESDDPIIVSKYTTHPTSNGEGIAITDINGTLDMPGGQLGYNGNTNGITILEMLINEGTTLSFGGQAPGAAYAAGYQTNTYEGTAIDDVAFYAEPLTNDQVAALYSKVLASTEFISDSKPDNPETSDKPDTPQTSETPDKPDTPQTSETPVTSEAPEASKAPTNATLGDVDGNGTVELKDAQAALKIALKIEKNPTAEQIAAGDIDGNGTVELKDAQAILKEALKITENFKAK